MCNTVEQVRNLNNFRQRNKHPLLLYPLLVHLSASNPPSSSLHPPVPITVTPSAHIVLRPARHPLPALLFPKAPPNLLAPLIATALFQQLQLLFLFHFPMHLNPPTNTPASLHLPGAPALPTLTIPPL